MAYGRLGVFAIHGTSALLPFLYIVSSFDPITHFVVQR